MPAQQSQPLSATAKRILDALEQFSSPVMDAKRMPIVGSKRKADSGSQRYAELNIPSTPDLLRVKQRERLQQSTSAARRAATASTPLPSPSPSPAPPQPTTQEYTIRKEDDAEKKKPTGKLKSKEKPSTDMLIEVKLPAAVLTVDKLPKIDIEIPPCPPPITTSYSTSLTKNKFKFSSSTAVPHSRTSAYLSAISTTSFKFSAPISGSVDSEKPVLSSSVSLPRTADDNEAHPKRRKSKDDNCVQPLVKVLSGNVTKTNILANSSWKSSLPSNSGQSSDVKIEGKAADSTSQMTCSVCKSQMNCEVCSVCQTKGNSKSFDTSKKTTVNLPTSTTGFGNLYKKPTGIWECPTCMIQNKNEASKCIACETAKPVAKKVISTSTDKKEVKETSSTMPLTSSGFGDKFKKPTGNWECQVCMISNKADSAKCVACETPKPGLQPNAVSKPETTTIDNKVSKGGFGNMFKKPSDSWTCNTCMITNDMSKVKCAACETPKPGVALQKPSEPTAPKFSFGIPSTTGSSASGVSSTFTFGIPKNNQTPDKASALTLPKGISTDSSKTQPIPPPTSTQTFSFGIQNAVKTDGESSVTNSMSAPMFQFGSDKTSQANSPGSKSSFKISSNVFGNTLKKASDELNKDVAKTEQIKPDLIKTSNVSSTSSATSNASEQKPINFLSSSKNVDTTISHTSGSEKATTPLFTFGTNTVKKSEESQDKSTASNCGKSPFAVGSSQWSISSSTTNTPTSSAAPSNVFKFGETNTVSSAGKSVSSSTSTSTQPSFTAPKANHAFSFGSTSSNEKKNENSFGVKEPIPNSNVNVTLASNENKPVFGSLATAPSSSTVFGNTGTVNAFGSSSFGNKDQTPSPFVPQTTSNVFGAIETASVSSTGTFSGFAQQASGFQTTTQENKVPAFNFGSTPSTEKPNNLGGFIFNPVSEKRTEPSFNFSSNQVNSATTAFSGFNNTLSTPSTTFNFEPKPFGPGIASPFAAPASASTPAPVFGAPSQQPTPVFGEQTHANPVFTFGSQAMQQPQTPANPGFDFGSKATMSQQQSTPVATSFVFGATPAQPATPAFDPNAKPTFNFSQGNTPVFSAIPTVNSASVPQQPIRKIRKAVRRTNVSSVRQT